MKRAHIIVYGLVHGVGFRSYVRNYAKELGFRGFVKNMPNGCVEIVAEGYEKQFSDFMQLLRKGPRGARVSEIKVDWQDATNEFKGFTIED